MCLPPSVTAAQLDLALSSALCGKLCACDTHIYTHTHIYLYTHTDIYTHKHTHIHMKEGRRGKGEWKGKEGNSARCDNMDKSWWQHTTWYEQSQEGSCCMVLIGSIYNSLVLRTEEDLLFSGSGRRQNKQLLTTSNKSLIKQEEHVLPICFPTLGLQ